MPFVNSIGKSVVLLDLCFAADHCIIGDNLSQISNADLTYIPNFKETNGHA